MHHLFVGSRKRQCVFSWSERLRCTGSDRFPHETRTRDMKNQIFPTRIETDRLVLEQLSHDTTDLFELYEFVSTEHWRGEATEPMPWFRFRTLEEVAGFIDHTEEQWRNRDSARYLLRTKDADQGPESPSSGTLVGTTAYMPEWDKRYGGSDIVLSKQYWDRGYGTERGAVFVELTFGHYDLDAYCTSCAAGNASSRGMIENLVDRYGGQYEGLMRQFGSPRPNGEVTDQHRYSISRGEYEEAITETESRIVGMEWWIRSLYAPSYWRTRGCSRDTPA